MMQERLVRYFDEGSRHEELIVEALHALEEKYHAIAGQ